QPPPTHPLLTPWRSFRQLSRTKKAAVLNSSLQRPKPGELLQHTGQFPYKPLAPPPASHACRHSDCTNVQLHHAHTGTDKDTHTHTHTHKHTHTHRKYITC